MVTDKDGFYTMKGYERSASDELTSSMEDYLEMVCRMEEEGEPIRVSSLAASLHVRPSSASKMLDNLKKAGYIDFKKYGSIMVTEKGYEEGRYLLHRHQVLQDFSVRSIIRRMNWSWWKRLNILLITGRWQIWSRRSLSFGLRMILLEKWDKVLYNV